MLVLFWLIVIIDSYTYNIAIRFSALGTDFLKLLIHGFASCLPTSVIQLQIRSNTNNILEFKPHFLCHKPTQSKKAEIVTICLFF